MKLKDKDLLVAHMKHGDFTQARLARAAGCTRQFVQQLTSGGKTSCREITGSRIEEALDVLPGTLFLRQQSTVDRPSVARRKTQDAA